MNIFKTLKKKQLKKKTPFRPILTEFHTFSEKVPFLSDSLDTPDTPSPLQCPPPGIVFGPNHGYT